jgi:hypothetical protein
VKLDPKIVHLANRAPRSKSGGRKASLRRHVDDSLESARVEIVRAQKARDDLSRARGIIYAARHIVNARDALAEVTSPHAERARPTNWPTCGPKLNVSRRARRNYAAAPFGAESATSKWKWNKVMADEIDEQLTKLVAADVKRSIKLAKGLIERGLIDPITMREVFTAESAAFAALCLDAAKEIKGSRAKKRIDSRAADEERVRNLTPSEGRFKNDE